VTSPQVSLRDGAKIAIRPIEPENREELAAGYRPFPREEGVRRFSAVILADNRPMLELLDDLGEVRFADEEFGAVEVEIDLPPEGVAAALRRTIRAAARGELSLRPRWAR
jgi:hypothetical protein